MRWSFWPVSITVHVALGIAVLIAPLLAEVQAPVPAPLPVAAAAAAYPQPPLPYAQVQPGMHLQAPPMPYRLLKLAEVPA